LDCDGTLTISVDLFLVVIPPVDGAVAEVPLAVAAVAASNTHGQFCAHFSRRKMFEIQVLKKASRANYLQIAVMTSLRCKKHIVKWGWSLRKIYQ